ncbi:E3 ubiquitin-protein ligase TRIM39-like [Denticeps clupeoides]|uniref:E3 ubiquitin-protein ligase TRIM39-like n=1 Tax=Denticeps clupeoides TaxID=299321 RepID=A0AAY4A2F7_9TELE|nr:E3 ubiquitin-protein ligase TRIM39-like [Denticeps clupeoides]XP_028822727.1 E3 ubiquitin-protein ligase TRIM39-like [Denticeps clupeoides]
MASSSSFLSEEQLQCSICLDVFTDPVSTSCGHNFCMGCIKEYWDNCSQTQCPVCKQLFPKRPELCINTFISELAREFKKKYSSISKRPDFALGSCDACTDRAVKSCLDCGLSFCKTHLEPHMVTPKLKKHKLMDPVENLEDYICKKHERPLQFFCRDDQTCVCQFCTESNHKDHNTVPVEEECGKKKSHLMKTQMKMQQKIQDRLRKIQEIKDQVAVRKKSTEEEISASVEIFTALLRSIERSQAELLEVMEEEQRAAERQAEGLVKDLQQEITELQRRNSELEKISHTEDHLHLLQIYPTLCRPPHTKNWADVSIHPPLSVETMIRSVSELETSFRKQMEKFTALQLNKVRRHAVDVTLDPDSAHPNLILSADGKQVRHGDKRQNLPDNPERFSYFVCALGKEGFSSGRFYYEVGVGGKPQWDLGVARESINRKEFTLSPEDGNWTVILRNGNEYKAYAGPPVLLSLSKKPQKVGVFVDYEEGLVSFYDVENSSHIYSFICQTFYEKLYPYFCPCLNDGGENSAPLIISPAEHHVLQE